MANYFSYMKKSFKLKNFIVYFILLTFIILFGSLATGDVLKASTRTLFENVGYSMIAALSLSLVVGFLGELSLGHAAFMSIGAIFGVAIQQTWLLQLTKAAPLVSLIIAMVVGGLISAVFGLLIGLPALRLKGDYLAIVTLAFGEIVKILFQNQPFFDGSLGLENVARTYYSKSFKTTLFVVIFVVVLIILIGIMNLIKSKHGRAIMAIRDNEIAARAMGVNVTYYKLFVFVLSAFIAGIAGVLYGATKNIIIPATFGYNYSINNILVIVVFGGMGNINGTLISAGVVTYLNTQLQTWAMFQKYPALQNMMYSLILILVVIYNNAPKLKFFREKYNLRKLINKLFKKKNNEKTQSNQVIYGADWSKIPTKIDMNAIVSTDVEVVTEGPDKPDKGGK